MNSPLTGKAVVVTRALHQADELNQALRMCGAMPLSYPCIAIVPPADPSALNQAVRDLLAGAFDWVVFTSSNSVRAVAESLNTISPVHQLNQRLKIAAIGTTTAQVVNDELGLFTNLIPTEHQAAQIANELSAVLPRGARVLLPQSEIADPALSQSLAAIGIAVTIVIAYRTVVGSGGVDVPGLLQTGQVDAIIFTSPSTVENFLQRLQANGRYIVDLNNICLAAIGQTTARAVERSGLTAQVVSSSQTITDLVSALEHYFAVERI